MSLLNQSLPKVADHFPAMAQGSPNSEKPKPKKTGATKIPCTPFCDTKAECPMVHHDLILTLMNCNDCQGTKSNVLEFQKCVIKCIDEGWDKNSVVPDQSVDLRYPLVHLACAFGKCLALEWLLQYGFDPSVKSEKGQFALQCGIQGMYKRRIKSATKEVVPKLRRMITAMPKQILYHDDVNGDTPLHTAALMLISTDQKSLYFQTCIETIAKESFKLDCASSAVLDAINYEGKTALHVLASATKKVEFCASAIRALVSAGADKTITDNNGETALDIAIAGGVQNIVQELLRDGESIYSELDHELEVPQPVATALFPSPSRTDDSDTNWSERASSRSSSTPSRPSSMPFAVSDNAPLSTFSLMGIKREKLLEIEEDNCGSPCACSPTEEGAPTPIDSNSPAVLKYLGDAGLLGDVSALVARARAQDEANMRKIESRANEIDIQIKNKEYCIQKMKQELSSLRNKRKECDLDFEKIRKRMHCCESAMKELPNL